MDMLDRVALVVTPKRRFLEWVNTLPEAGSPITIDEAKSLRTVFLAAVGDQVPDLQDLIDTYCEDLFEQCLAAWASDESLWPANRNPHVFRDWCQVECVDDVFDADPSEPLLVSERMLTRCANCEAPLEELGEGVAFVGLGKGGARRLTAEEAGRLEQTEEAGEAGDPAGSTVVLRCCGAECASQLEGAYTRALTGQN